MCVHRVIQLTKAKKNVVTSSIFSSFKYGRVTFTCADLAIIERHEAIIIQNCNSFYVELQAYSSWNFHSGYELKFACTHGHNVTSDGEQSTQNKTNRCA